MAPFRRRGKTARNLALAEAALALAKDRDVAASSKRSRGRLLLVGGAVVAAGAAALLKRDKVAGLLPSRSGDPAPAAPLPGAVAAVELRRPGPGGQHRDAGARARPAAGRGRRHEPIDEAAEEAAAAAEAAAHRRRPRPSTPARTSTSRPTRRFRPLAEAGEGESEGLEQAEADLADNATYRDAGLSDAEAQIEEAIEEADQPFAGETLEGVAAEDAGPEPEAPAEAEPAQGTFLPPTPAPEVAEPEPEAAERARPASLRRAEPEPEAAEPEPEPQPEAEAEAEEPSEPPRPSSSPTPPPGGQGRRRAGRLAHVVRPLRQPVIGS